MTFRHACVLSLLFASATFADVIREGTGDRRTQLARMELAPFPAEAWSSLSDWTNGPAPTSADLSGKPILICTWASWHKVGAQAVKLAVRMSERHANDGLIVVLAHDPEGWKDAEKPKPPVDGATLLVAHDAKGDFRKALRSDNNPDFYVIDRAGQLRYADIATESVEEAISTVMAEKSEDAAGTKARIAKEKEEAARKALLTGGLREVDLTALPELPYTPPAPEKYEKAAFPAMPRDPNQSADQQTVRGFPLPESGYFPSKPEMKGRVIVAYFWHPTIVQTYDPVMAQMELLQRQKGRDIAVIGVVSKLVRTTYGGQEKMDEEEVDPAKALARLQRIAQGRKINHAMIPDYDATLLGAATPSNANSIPFGFGCIVSSDGNIRWMGTLDESGNFRGMLDRIIEADPGVKVRRENEAAYIKSKK